jgi:CheY-like chemotaxis protein
MPIVLCVDDYRAGLVTRKLLLEQQGYFVLTAEDGLTGLSLLKHYNVNAVVLDYQMKEMDGAAVAKIIRKEHPSLPIILLTGLPHSLPKSLAGLVDAIITKGQGVEVLLSTLHRLTGTESAPAIDPADLERQNKIDTEEAKKLQEESKTAAPETQALPRQKRRQAG